MAIDQEVKFEKNFGPKLGEINLDKFLNTSQKLILVRN